MANVLIYVIPLKGRRKYGKDKGEGGPVSIIISSEVLDRIIIRSTEKRLGASRETSSPPKFID